MYPFWDDEVQKQHDLLRATTEKFYVQRSLRETVGFYESTWHDWMLDEIELGPRIANELVCQSRRGFLLDELTVAVDRAIACGEEPGFVEIIAEIGVGHVPDFILQKLRPTEEEAVA